MVGMLIITHDHIGTALLEAACTMLTACPLATQTLSVYADSDPDELVRRAREQVQTLDQGDGVLVLTDLYGSTPSNVASRLTDGERVMVVSGVNLPMLVRIMNYPRAGLAELATKAESGGRDSIFLCGPATGL